MKKIIILISITFVVILQACSGNESKSDAYGNFEATEIIVHAEAQGKIVSLNIREGAILKKGTSVGLIDSIQLHLSKEQLRAKKQAIAARLSSIEAEADVLKEQKNTIIRERKRIKQLLEDDAATEKQLDDIEGKLKVAEKQIQAVKTQKQAVYSELKALTKQIEQVNDKLKNCIITNPIKGRVLDKYIEIYEMVIPGKSLYKIADMETMFLRVYISGAQLPAVKLGQEVEVLYDKKREENYSIRGTINWISDEAEFTPKIIQTKEERVNLVYAMKVKVKNDGSIKIGMPGEVNFK